MGDAESTNKIAADDCADCEDDQPTSAVACCEKCAKCMCAKHAEVHSKLKSCRHHVVVPITGTKKAPVTKMAPAMCAEHPKQELVGCCRNCNNVPVCLICMFNSHKAHTVCPFAEVMAEDNTFLKNAVVVLSGHVGVLNTALTKVSDQKKSLDESLTTATIGLMEGLRKVQDRSLGYMNGVTTENQTMLNGQHLTLEVTKMGVVGLKTAALDTMDCADYGHHSVKVNTIRREMAALKSDTWPLEPCSTVLVFYDDAKLQGITDALVYTNECKAKDCRAAVTGNGKQRNLTITALDMQKRGAVGVVFEVQLKVPSGAVQVFKITGDQHGQYASAIELAEEGQSTLTVMLRGTAVPGSPFTLVFHAGPPRWNITPAYLPADHQVTEDGRLLTKTGGIGAHKTSITAMPVATEVLFTIVADPSGSNLVMLGMATLGSFRLNQHIYNQAGAYMLYCQDGALFGSGKSYTAYAQKVTVGSTVRCVRDLAAGTISFVVNGVNKGVAFTDVPPGDLYAVVDLYYVGESVRLG